MVDSLMEERLLLALQQVASCKNAFVRQELAFYLHQIWDFLPSACVRIEVMRLIQLLMHDPAPCCRLALAKLLRRLCMREWTTQMDLLDELKTMLEKLSTDEAPGVREEASALSRDC